MNDKLYVITDSFNNCKYISIIFFLLIKAEQMYDIATSKYKQLQQIRDIHISEVDPSESEKQNKWEFPKKRMIQLKLTDGLQDVIGIEYNYISRLNVCYFNFKYSMY